MSRSYLQLKKGGKKIYGEVSYDGCGQVGVDVKGGTLWFPEKDVRATFRSDRDSSEAMLSLAKSLVDVTVE